jgi:cytochrome c oxidase accessory protein FixG
MTAENQNQVDLKDSPGYRDRIATIDESGRRRWVFPRKPRGPLHRARAIVSWVLLAILFAGPFIKINGQPLLLLNVIDRKFIIFGMAFWPQDFHLFVLAMIAAIVAILLFTVVFGRLFCGWACPQTIFMEMVFRKIEYWIDGDYRAQRKLREAPWDATKIFKRITKHGIFYGISFLIGNIFLAYIIGIEELGRIVTAPPSEHLAGLTAMVLFSGAFYFVFAWFREQVCTLVCPYGRLQSVLLDDRSIVVAYDWVRGEDRKRFRRGEDRSALGDCIDCHQCVDVCPTGIDIRDGTQLECVNCTACIDACNEVMEKVDLPKGLIRYDSYEGIKNGLKLKPSLRMFGYSAVLVTIVAVLMVLIFTRSDVETTILRSPGTLYQEIAEDRFTNLYTVKMVNKTFGTLPVRLELLEPAGELRMVGNDLSIEEQGIAQGAFFVELERQQLDGVKTPIRIAVYNEDRVLETVKTAFMGPSAYND